MNPLFILGAFLIGGCIAVQAPINNQLAGGIGRNTLAAALVSFVVGTLALGAGAIASGTLPGALSALPRQPLWTFSGGLLGAAYIFGSVYLVPRLGLAALLALVIAGQLAFSLTLDHFGLIGLAARRLTPMRALGGAVVMAGVLLILFGDRWVAALRAS